MYNKDGVDGILFVIVVDFDIVVLFMVFIYQK